MRLRLSSFVLTFFAACSDPEGSVTIVTGEETGVFSRDPAPVTLVTEVVALDGTRKELSRKPLPVDSVDLGDLQQSDIGGIAITGLGADNEPLVKGESLLVQWGAIRDQTLQVFAQRTGELARVPSGPAAIDVSPALMVEGRFVLGITGSTAFIYDLLTWHTLSGQPTLPRAATSVAAYGSAALLINADGATSFDLQTGETLAFDPPAGGTFAEVAGGARIGAPDSSQLIVGPTRLDGGSPTPRVLLVDASGVASFAAMIAPRAGACATYVDGRGLLVYGGDATAAGAEILAPAATVAAALPYAPDPVKGCAAVTLDPTHVLIVGGQGADPAVQSPPRVLDLACTASCALTPWPGTVPLVRTEAAPLAADAALVVGDDAGGQTHVYRASAAGVTELSLKTPRRNARLVRAPTDALLVVGGGSPGIEMYRE